MSITPVKKWYRMQRPVELAESFYENRCCVKNLDRKLRDMFTPHNRTSTRTIKRVFEKFQRKSSLKN